MVIEWFYAVHVLKSWLYGEEGVAAIEAAMLLPLMVTVMLGVFDLGTGLVLSKRVITSSQIAADLIARDKTVNLNSVNDAIAGSMLAFEPYPIADYGIDIASIEFDNYRRPRVLWRETRDMAPNHNAVDSVSGIGDPGEGMVIVTVQYIYRPLFARYFTDNFEMQEVAFARGRRSPTVTWE